MANVLHFAMGLTGGGAEDLDGILTADITDGDLCIVADGNDRTYRYDSSETAVESSPNIINPDDNTGNGRWVLQKQSGVPVGTTIEWRTATVPDDYLECDGSAISRTTYASLFAVIGTMYGVGDGSTTFNIPDDRGEFKRGFDNTAGNDPDAASRADRGDGTTGDNIGTKQSDEIGSHTHSAKTTTNNPNVTTGGTAIAGWSDGDTGATGGNETRPRNISVIYCIKYK